MREGRPWIRWVLGPLLVLGALLVVARLVADPVAKWMVGRALSRADAYAHHVDDVHVSFFPPGTTIRGLSLRERRAPAARAPLLYVRELRSALQWRQLTSGVAVFRQTVSGAKLTLFAPLAPRALKEAERATRREMPDLLATLRKLPAARADRIEVRDAELLLVDTSAPGRPRLWAHAVNGVVKDLVTKKKAGTGVPTTMMLEGDLQRSGRFGLAFATDPRLDRPRFDMRVRVEGLHLQEVHGFMAARADVVPSGGWMDMETVLRGRGDILYAYVRPALHEVEVAPAEEGGVGARIKSWLVQTGADLLSDDEDRESEELSRSIQFTAPLDPQADPASALLGALGEALDRALDAIPGGRGDAN